MSGLFADHFFLKDAAALLDDETALMSSGPQKKSLKPKGASVVGNSNVFPQIHPTTSLLLAVCLENERDATKKEYKLISDN